MTILSSQTPKQRRAGLLALGTIVGLGLDACAGAGGDGGKRGQVTQDAIDPGRFGSYRALIIGINRYSEWPHLAFAEQDAQDIRDVLVSQYGISAGEVITLLGQAATESNIVGELRTILGSAGVQDNVLIYYAGHGQLDAITETGFWIPVDGDLDDETTWIPFSTIRDLVTAANGKAKGVALITDSCYGGALTRGGPPPKGFEPGGDGYGESLLRLADKKYRYVIASGGFETVPDRSQFAELLKDALRNNDHQFVDLEFLFWGSMYPHIVTTGMQRPVMARLVEGPDYAGQFVLVRSNVAPEPGRAPAPEAEVALWNAIKERADPELFAAYLKLYPSGAFAALATQRLHELSGAPEPVPGPGEGSGTTTAPDGNSHAGGGSSTKADAGHELASDTKSERQIELEFWNAIKGTSKPDLFAAYLERYPEGAFTVSARRRLDELSGTPVPDVIGLTKDEAARRLQASGFTVLQVVERESRETPRDTVLRQIPAGGTRADTSTSITIAVAAGVPPAKGEPNDALRRSDPIRARLAPPEVITLKTQAIDRYSGSAMEVTPARSAAQTFTAAGTEIHAVSIFIKVGNLARGGDTLTLTLRSLDRPVTLMTQRRELAERFEGWVTFKPRSPLRVRPGGKFVIEVQDTGKSVHFWAYGADTYSGGCLRAGGRDSTQRDFFFRVE